MTDTHDLDIILAELRRAGANYRSSREQAEADRLDLHDAIKIAAGTVSQSEIARVTGIRRVTVRTILGKS